MLMFVLFHGWNKAGLIFNGQRGTRLTQTKGHRWGSSIQIHVHIQILTVGKQKLDIKTFLWTRNKCKGKAWSPGQRKESTSRCCDPTAACCQSLLFPSPFIRCRGNQSSKATNKAKKKAYFIFVALKRKRLIWRETTKQAEFECLTLQQQRGGACCNGNIHRCALCLHTKQVRKNSTSVCICVVLHVTVHNGTQRQKQELKQDKMKFLYWQMHIFSSINDNKLNYLSIMERNKNCLRDWAVGKVSDCKQSLKPKIRQTKV